MLKQSCKTVIWSAAKASATALIPLSIIRVPALTKITSEMADEVVSSYGYKSLSGISTFFSIVLGAATGVRIANEVLERIPGIGTCAACVSTASLHLFTGAVLVGVCEMIKAGRITDAELQNTGFCKILCGRLVKNATQIVGNLIRGRNPIEFAYQ